MGVARRDDMLMSCVLSVPRVRFWASGRQQLLLSEEEDPLNLSTVLPVRSDIFFMTHPFFEFSSSFLRMTKNKT